MTILAIDFGGTQVKSALVSEDFVLAKSLPTQSSPKTLDQALDVIDHLVTSVEVALLGIAISVPGTVDTEEGVIYHGGLLRFFHGFRIKEVLQAKYHLPVAALVLGLGLGGDIIINGRLFPGKSFPSRGVDLSPSSSNGKS